MSSDAVFLDTVGILAVVNSSDRWHSAAMPVYARLREEDICPVTTSFVLAECANAASRSHVREHVCHFRDQLEAVETVLIPDAGDWNAAWEAYRRGEAGGAGLVDHLSFVVMRRLGIGRAFTNDRHFRAAGFEPLF